ncbi:MAG: hypothetical protein Q9191_007578 [Dirinaria sp. TL-2023a]
MPRAEVGSTKYLNNKLKSKGLQRLRWYCQVCERQMRDENGFKCHTQSESHVRQMLLIGEDPRKHINDYSNQFQRDFLQLLRTAHGEKKVHINHFYQEYISNKEHIHMNATRWPSLTEFAKYLGREGICRVEDNEKGIHVSWIDNSPEALRRQDAIRKKERQDRGDEEREQKLIREQIERAEMDVEQKAIEEGEQRTQELQRQEGETIKLNFGKPKEKQEAPVLEPSEVQDADQKDRSGESDQNPASPPEFVPTPPPEKVSLKMSTTSKPKNVFASAKKNALTGSKHIAKEAPKKPMSEAERIMKEEIERKRMREANGFSGLNAKRQRVS